MRAVYHRSFGLPDGLELRELDQPALTDHSVLVRVRASSINPAEWYAVMGQPYVARPAMGLRRPKQAIPGADFAGEVAAIGPQVTRFRPGDAVFGGCHGAFAEYVRVHEERSIVAKPDRLTFEEAAALPTAAITALQGLRDKGQLQPGQQVLINGASGGVGTFAVQIAKALGATVTAVCSTRHVDLVRSIGADQVIDYTREDFTRGGQRYDLLLDVAGSRSWAAYRRVLKPRATFVLVGGPKTNRWLGPIAQVAAVHIGALGASQTVTFFVAQFNRADFLVLRELAESGRLRPVIDRRYPLTELPAALGYLGEGHARGKIVITM